MNKYILPIFMIVILVVFSTIEIIPEGKKGIRLHFNEVKRDSNNIAVIYEPGLNFKIPFVESIKKLDARIQTLNSTADRFVTVEKKDLLVDSYVKWRIVNFAKFFTATGGGNYERANDLLKRKVNDRLRSEIGSRTIKDIVSGTRGELMEGAKNMLNDGSTANIGIEVIDVRIKQINLPDEVSSAIYERMRAERTIVATSHRSQGNEQSAFIQAMTDRKITLILANATKKAQELRAEGDLIAAKIYSDAFSQEPDFYSFIRSLKAYENSFVKSKNILILKPDSQFFRYMEAPIK